MQFWPDPLDGLDPTDPASGLDPYDAPWNLDAGGQPQDGGKTKNPPNQRLGWRRWYFIYQKLDGTRVKVSADQDPDTGQWKPAGRNLSKSLHGSASVRRRIRSLPLNSPGTVPAARPHPSP